MYLAILAKHEFSYFPSYIFDLHDSQNSGYLWCGSQEV